MKKLFILIFLQFAVIQLFSQNLSIKDQLEKLARKTIPATKIYINNNSKHIELETEQTDFDIPLKNVSVYYHKNTSFPSNNFVHFVSFECKIEVNCIRNIEENNSLSNTVSIPLYSKEDCYKFINLLALLN
jgi:hypothetical protein